MTDERLEPDEIPQVLASYALATLFGISENWRYEHEN